MDTFFLPAARDDIWDIDQQVGIVCKHPVVDGVMQTAGGLLAVLNEHRQILAVNDALLRAMGIEDAASVLGLRPGEAAQCIHSHEMPGGCGTSRYCVSCGAAIALMAAITENRSETKKCCMTVRKNGSLSDLCLEVRTCPLRLEGRRLVLLFLQDISIHEWRASLERTFFHDINNILAGLTCASDLMDFRSDGELREMVRPLQQMVHRISREIKIQDVLSQSSTREYPPDLQQVSTREILQEQADLFATHPVAKNRTFSLRPDSPDLNLTTDATILSRILMNMIKNAFEAIPAGEEVRLWVEQGSGEVRFCVWNPGEIPEEVSLRMFQRHFSTKKESGRGMGTYAMKLLGESMLKGRVGFSTSPGEGTQFTFALPLVSGRWA